MPYLAPGKRHTATATKQCQHGQLVTENGFVGVAFKSKQVDRWVRPTGAAPNAKTILVGEQFELMLGGIVECPMTGGAAALAVGDKVYVATADNAVSEVATGAVLLGVVTEIDLSRTPDVARINAENYRP